MTKQVATIDRIVGYLLACGNVLAGNGMTLDQGGPSYVFTKSIDFDALEAEFYFPKHIQLLRNDDQVHDSATWVSIDGPKAYAKYSQR
ncbi:hypothetical protein [Paraperlucidibaca sp.]|jgi:hypothetical protein|uniref:hypothetical protein n=1 Tax=Paraperlucidibaca sp. TaxID=2708021 RepID=UPI0030F42BD7